MHSSNRLRRERDLGDEHDRAEPALEHLGARLEVDLGLARAGRAEEEIRPAAGGDPCDRGLLLGRELGGLVLTGERLPPGRRCLLFSALRCFGRNECERTARRGAVVLGDPERKVDERRRHGADNAVDRTGLDAGRRRLTE